MELKEAERANKETWEKNEPWKKVRYCDFEVTAEDLHNQKIFDARKLLLEEEIEGRKIKKHLKQQLQGK